MNAPIADPLLAAIDPAGDGFVSAGGPPWRAVADPACVLELDSGEWELLRSALSESSGNEHLARKLGLSPADLSDRLGRLAGKLESTRPHAAG